MEWVKLILNFITSFFNNSTQKKIEEVKLADATTTAVIETIRANENVIAVQQQEKIQEQLDELQVVQKKERKNAKTKPIRDRVNDQFGSDQ